MINEGTFNDYEYSTGYTIRLNDSKDKIAIVFENGSTFSGFHTADLVGLYNFWRDLGSLLDTSNPGIVYPLPPEEDAADAMIFIKDADERRKK